MVKLLALIALAVILFACSPEDLPYSFSDLPPGDAARGAALFAQSVKGAPACANCHAIDDSASAGPSLQGYGQIAASQVKSQSAAEYTFYSILRPAKHVVRGFSNVMYAKYGDQLSQQDVADLIAYLLGL